MVSILISGHGQLSVGILDAFEMIFGSDPDVQAIPFLKGEGLPQVNEKFTTCYQELNDTQELLILVDVFGGTPYNAAAQLAYGKNNVDIVTGVNLPMVLEAAAGKNQSLSQLVDYLKQTSKEAIKSFKEEVSSIQSDADDEEDLL
uniref:PTS sugar transporter subunit IIA n=1 Tax=Candidatus Enterococcus willemsii TaxID=1857215 RepID=UPI00403F80BC